MSSEPGPAYPCEWNYIGMTLRDYFAAKAMAALIMEPPFAEGEKPAVSVWDDRDNGQPGLERFAYVAYRVADAMLAARAKP